VLGLRQDQFFDLVLVAAAAVIGASIWFYQHQQGKMGSVDFAETETQSLYDEGA
jgi:hypothetical protein